MTTRVTVNTGNINNFVASDKGMGNVLKNVATGIMADAEMFAPRHPSPGIKGGPGHSAKRETPKKKRAKARTRNYAKSFVVKPFRNHYRLWNESPFAGFVELGTRNNPPYAPIRKAARKSGQRFTTESDTASSKSVTRGAT